MHPFRRFLDHRGEPYGPDALRLPCAVGAVLFSLSGGYRGLAPLACRMVGGWSFGDSFAQPCRSMVLRYPRDLPDGAGAIASGADGRQWPPAAGFVGLAHPYPVPACLPLGGAL